jgi:uncharacterized integral membrane protein
MPDRRDDRRDGEGSGVTPRMVAGGILLLAAIAFALDNRRRVRVGYVFGETRISMIVVILAMLAVGAFIGYVAARRRD